MRSARPLIFVFGLASAALAAEPDPLGSALADLQAKRYEQAIEKLEDYRDRLEHDDPASPRLAEALFHEAECRYLLGDKYAAHKLYREILERHYKDFPMLAQAISREYEIGTAFIDGKAERPILFFRVKSQALGVEILNYLIENYQEKYFDYAQYLIADYHFRDKDWRRAADAYLRIEEDFAESHWVPVAMFQRALCYLRMNRGYRYDDTQVRRAEELLLEYVRKYPRGDRIKDAEAILAGIREDRAKLYVEVARFYLHREKKPRAALIYVEAILREAPEAPAAGDLGPILAGIARYEEKDPASARRARDIAAALEQNRTIAGPASAPAPAAGAAGASAGAGGPGTGTGAGTAATSQAPAQ